MTYLERNSVKITDGFWNQKRELNRKTTINAVWDRFYDTGRINAFKFDWKEGMDNKPHIFWDSDVAKWMEAAAYLIEEEYDENGLSLTIFDEMFPRNLNGSSTA